MIGESSINKTTPTICLAMRFIQPVSVCFTIVVLIMKVCCDSFFNHDNWILNTCFNMCLIFCLTLFKSNIV